MTIVHDDLWVCGECTLLVACGEEHREGIADAMKALWPNAYLVIDHETNEFSWQACDGCGSPLGGSRHKATAIAIPFTHTTHVTHTDERA